jgi:acyl-CoA reductase-like NAD-dependent aldehyde dehydrogenase
MMAGLSINLTTTVDRVRLLEKVKENAAKHKAVVAEARAGYLERARKALEARLAELATGKVVSLTFSLNPPQDYTSAYETVIRMLEWTKDETVTLQADEFRHLIEDRWDWTDRFYAGNSLYSKRASDWVSGATDDDAPVGGAPK